MGTRRYRQDPKTGQMRGAVGGPGTTPPTIGHRTPVASAATPTAATDTVAAAWQAYQRLTRQHAPADTNVDTAQGNTDLAHFHDLLTECGGDRAAAMSRLPARLRQQHIVDTSAGTITIDPPGTHRDQYVLDADGRPAELYYASYGSNLSADRFYTYLNGGALPGTERVYTGARDKRPVGDDVALPLNGTLFFAGESRTWGGGVAFLDPTTSGRTLGRAYLITSTQFDDVVAQENFTEPGSVKVDTATVIAEGRSIDPGVYGALVHVGDYRGRPVVTFTSPFTAADAHRGQLTVTPEGTIADRAARDAEAAQRRAAHETAQQQLPADKREPFKEDWPVYLNAPTKAYLSKIADGLEETYRLPNEHIDDYFAGSLL